MNKKVLKRRVKFVVDPVANYVLRANHRCVQLYARYYESLAIKPQTILYECRDGKSMTDSPYAMFTYMLKHPDYQGFTHIWSVQDADALEPVIQQYKSYRNVKFVRRHSKRYLKILASAQYLINNSTFPSYFIPKEEQIYINTWHGTPLKKMGFDIPGNPSTGYNVVRNFLCTDFLLSPNAHTTEVFQKSYKLDGLYQGTIIEEGYPRIDLTLQTDPKEMRDCLRSYGVKIDEHKATLLYAPTWKGASVTKVNNDIQHMLADLRYLEAQVGDQFNLLLKVHPFLYKQATNQPELMGHLIPDFVDTNELLATIDVLVTDYSSIFFDFLVTDKPILFYTWDMDVYHEERGQYLQNDELPGPLLYNAHELTEALLNLEKVTANYREIYQNAKKRFVHHDNGKVTERIVPFIFQQSKQSLNTISGLGTSKEKILIYPGGLRNNGITSSFINLSNNLDYEKYDVTCFLPTSQSPEVLNNMKKVNPKVRFLFKGGLPAYQLFEHYRDKFVHNRGRNGRLGKWLYPETAFNREHKRLFGKATFDYVIDFSGYSLYWAKLLLVANAKKKICFMHSDMLADSEKNVNGKRPHRINLRGLFSVYDQFDKLISVSEGTMSVNKQKLSTYASEDKFAYVMNSIYPERIFQQQPAETNNTVPQVEDYKSRAVIKGATEYWNTLPLSNTARKLPLPENIHEIIVMRKAEANGQTYYKFSHHHQVLGWIEADFVQLVPDSLLQEVKVSKLARIAWPKGISIWSKPYNVEGAERVSSSLNFKNLIVDIDKEAETQRGTYYQISINRIKLGWIHEAALHMYEDCTIHEPSAAELARALVKRKALKARNYNEHKEILQNLMNRPLRETRVMKPIYAKITKTGNELIWTHPYPHWDAQPKGRASWLEGEAVTIKAVMQTRTGIYYLFYKDNNKIGWLHAGAFEMIKQPTLIQEKEIVKKARLRLRATHAIWTKPYGLEGAEKIEGYKKYDGLNVEIDREVTTQRGTYSRILLEDAGELGYGWVSSHALEVKEQLGRALNGHPIPEPDPDYLNFVHMGRLSPEKGQDNLLKAFARFHQNYEKSRLYILGDGALRKDLENLINELKLAHAVYMLGQVENPFQLMKKCDCFILSSHYEGQPMVLLEAMTLGMKIIATDIIANRTVLENGKYGLLVENSINGLVEGMRQIISEKNTWQPEPFDYQLYNELAMETFYKPLE